MPTWMNITSIDSDLADTVIDMDCVVLIQKRGDNTVIAMSSGERIVAKDPAWNAIHECLREIAKNKSLAHLQ